MREIEILVKVLEDEKEVEKKLRKVSKYLGDVKIEDIYYFDPLRKELQPTIGKQLREVFRLRRKDGKVYLAHKHNYYTKKGKWLYSDEFETMVHDFTITKNIIKSLGFKELVHLHMVKKTFKTKQFEIVLENVKDLGLFLEVEALRVGKREHVSIIKEKIEKFIKGLDIKTSKESGVSKPELVLKL